MKNKVQKIKVEIQKKNLSIIEFIEDTKKGKFTHKDVNIPQEYVIRYDFTENINELNETIEQYHFGITN